MNLTKMNLIASQYYKCKRRREKRKEGRRRKRRCPPPPPPSPASPPPAQSQTPATEPPRKRARVRAYAFNSSDSDYSPNAYSDKSDSDFSTPRKRTKLFSDADEIKILKGLLYMNRNDDRKASVTDEVAEYINKSLRRNAEFTKTQFRSKIRRIKEKYNKNRDNEGKFYKLCAKIWGDNKVEQQMNSSSPLLPRLLFENDSFAADTNVDGFYVEDSYAEDSENHENEEGNASIARRVEIKRKFKELDIMELELSLKRLALMRETIAAVL